LELHSNKQLKYLQRYDLFTMYAIRFQASIFLGYNFEQGSNLLESDGGDICFFI